MDGGSFFELTFFEDRMVGWLKIEDCAAALGLEVELSNSQDDDPPFFADVVVVRRKPRAAATQVRTRDLRVASGVRDEDADYFDGFRQAQPTLGTTLASGDH